jgi:hypothetical protein
MKGRFVYTASGKRGADFRPNFICWPIFNELFVLTMLRKSSPFGTLRRAG